MRLQIWPKRRFRTLSTWLTMKKISVSVRDILFRNRSIQDLLSTVAPAVAKAAMESNVAQIKIENWETYAIDLNKRLGLDNQLMRVLGSKARSDPRRLVFAEADNIKILKVAQILFDEGVAYPILLGNKERIRSTACRQQN